MNSALYQGRVRHRRREPVEHEFELGLFFAWLDLAELPHVFDRIPFASVGRWNLLSFRRRDYLGDPGVSLDRAVRDLVAGQTGRRPQGPIRMLTHLRMLGHCFNPVTFYYCYDESGDAVDTIVAEITNTPWGERHAYVLPRADSIASGPLHRHRFGKSFHVSPFMPMDLEHDWRFTEPSNRLIVHMENHGENGAFFDATLTLARRPLRSSVLARLLARWPFGTLRVVASIYAQALRLWWKGVRFHPHPRTRSDATESPSHEYALDLAPHDRDRGAHRSPGTRPRRTASEAGAVPSRRTRRRRSHGVRRRRHPALRR